VARATEETYDAVRSSILAGSVAPGSRLGEVELADQLGVSRTPVREALQRLAAEGLVEALPHRGARVAQWSTEDLTEIYALRALLESHGAARAAERITPDTLIELAALCEEMDACAGRRALGGQGPQGRRGPGARGGPDLDRLTALNAEFHDRITATAASPRLTALLGAVVHVPLSARTFHRYSPEALRRSLGHHRELIAALSAGDSEWAGSVMRSHVHAARTALLDPGLDSFPGVDAS